MPELPESERCMYTSPAGRRCRKGRMTQSVFLCYYHLEAAEKQAADSEAVARRLAARGEITRRLLPARDGLNSAADVRRFLSRVTRAVVDGQLDPRTGNSLGYLGQLLLTTIAQRNLERDDRAAARAAANRHPLLGEHLPEVEKLIGFLGDAIAESQRNEEQASNHSAARDVDSEDSSDDVESASTESDPSAGGSQ